MRIHVFLRSSVHNPTKANDTNTLGLITTTVITHI